MTLCTQDHSLFTQSEVQSGKGPRSGVESVSGSKILMGSGSRSGTGSGSGILSVAEIALTSRNIRAESIKVHDR